MIDPLTNPWLHVSVSRKHNGDVDDSTVTCFGILGEGLAHAALRRIAITARAPLIALNDIHLRLGIDDTSSGAEPAEAPTRRWQLLMKEFFGPTYSHPARLMLQNRAVRGLPELDAIPLLAVASDEEKRVLSKLFHAVGVFFVGESVTLHDQAELARDVHVSSSTSIDVEEVRSRINQASAAGRWLCERAEPDRLGELFTGQPTDPVLASTQSVDDPARGAVTQSAAADVWDTGPSCRRVVVVLVDLHVQAAMYALAARILDAVRVRSLAYRGGGAHATAVVLATSNGQLSAEIPLGPPGPEWGEYQTSGEIDRWLEAALRQVSECLFTLAYDDGEQPQPAEATQSYDHWVDMLAELSFAADTLQANHVVIASDSLASAAPTVPSDQDSVRYQRQLLDQLSDAGQLPDLRGVSVTLVGMPLAASTDHPRVARERYKFWLDLCAAANALSCEIDLGGCNAGNAHRGPTHRPRPARPVDTSCRRLLSAVEPPDHARIPSVVTRRTPPEPHLAVGSTPDRPMAYVVKERRTVREIVLSAAAFVSATVLYMTWTFVASRSGSTGLLVAVAVTAAVALVGLMAAWIITARRGEPTRVFVWTEIAASPSTADPDQRGETDNNHAREVATAH